MLARKQRPTHSLTHSIYLTPRTRVLFSFVLQVSRQSARPSIKCTQKCFLPSDMLLLLPISTSTQWAISVVLSAIFSAVIFGTEKSGLISQFSTFVWTHRLSTSKRSLEKYVCSCCYGGFFQGLSAVAREKQLKVHATNCFKFICLLDLSGCNNNFIMCTHIRETLSLR